jgi:TPR repeat protein
MRFADGRRHEGEWQAGEPRGPGIRTSPAGYSLAGDWHQGALQAGTLVLAGLPPYEGPLFGPEGQLAPAARSWLTGHAGTGNNAAAFLLAVRGPDAEARKGYLLQAANGDVAAAQLMLGRQLLAQDTRAALTWLQRAAAHDDQPQPVAHFLLGQLYHLGTDLPQDEDQAEDHYQRAIALGSISARRNLALMLATTSISYLRDPERAIAILAPVARYYNDPELLDALAAVFDAAGRSADAEAARQAAGQARQPEQQPT